MGNTRASARKTAAKTAEQPEKIPQSHGGALLAGGVPGNKGGTGRPPNWFRDWCEELLASKKSLAQVRAIVQDKDHPAYATMWKSLADRVYGKPKESVDHTSGGRAIKYVTFDLGSKRVS